MSLIMADKIASSQFWVIYQELTRDTSVADNKICKEVDGCMQLILQTADETIIQDLRINNEGHLKQFDAFMMLLKKNLMKFRQWLWMTDTIQ